MRTLTMDVIDRDSRKKVGECSLALDVQRNNAVMTPEEKIVALRRENVLCEIIGDGEDEVLGYLAVTFDVQWGAEQSEVEEGWLTVPVEESGEDEPLSNDDADGKDEVASSRSLESLPSRTEFMESDRRTTRSFNEIYTVVNLNDKQESEAPEEKHTEEGQNLRNDFERIQRLLNKGKALQHSMEIAVNDTKDGHAQGMDAGVGGEAFALPNMAEGTISKQVQEVLSPASYGNFSNSAVTPTWDPKRNIESRNNAAAHLSASYNPAILTEFSEMMLTFESLELERDFVDHTLRQLRDLSSVSSRFSPIQISVSHSHVASLLYKHTDEVGFPEVPAFAVTTSLRKRQWLLTCSSRMSLTPPFTLVNIVDSDAFKKPGQEVKRKLQFFVRCKNQNDVQRSKRRDDQKRLSRPSRCIVLIGFLDVERFFSMAEPTDTNWSSTIQLFFEENRVDARKTGNDSHQMIHKSTIRRNKKKTTVGYLKIKVTLAEPGPSNHHAGNECTSSIDDNESELFLSSLSSTSIGATQTHKPQVTTESQSFLMDHIKMQTIAQEPHLLHDAVLKTSSSKLHGTELLQFAVMLENVSLFNFSAGTHFATVLDQTSTTLSKEKFDTRKFDLKNENVSVHYAVPTQFTKTYPAPTKFERIVRRKLKPSRWLDSVSFLRADFSGITHVFQSTFAQDASEYFSSGHLVCCVLHWSGVLDGTLGAIVKFQAIVRGFLHRKRQRQSVDRSVTHATDSTKEPNICSLAKNQMKLYSEPDSQSTAATLTTAAHRQEMTGIKNACPRVADNANEKWSDISSDTEEDPSKVEHNLALRKIRFNIRECWKSAMQRGGNYRPSAAPILGCELQGQLVLTGSSGGSDEHKRIPFALWWDAESSTMNSYFVHTFREIGTHQRKELGTDLPRVGPQSQVLFALHVENGFFGAQSREIIVGEARLNLYDALREQKAKLKDNNKANDSCLYVDVSITWDIRDGENINFPSVLPLKISYDLLAAFSEVPRHPTREQNLVCGDEISCDSMASSTGYQSDDLTSVSGKRLQPASVALSFSLFALAGFGNLLTERRQQGFSEKLLDFSSSTAHLNEMLSKISNSQSVIFDIEICLGSYLHEREDILQTQQTSSHNTGAYIFSKDGFWYKRWRSHQVTIQVNKNSHIEHLDASQLGMRADIVLNPDIVTKLQEDLAEVTVLLCCTSCNSPHALGSAEVPLAGVLFRPQGVRGMFPVRAGAARIGVHCFIDHSDKISAPCNTTSHLDIKSKDRFVPPPLVSPTSPDEIGRAEGASGNTRPPRLCEISIQEGRNLTPKEYDVATTHVYASFRIAYEGFDLSVPDVPVNAAKRTKVCAGICPQWNHNEAVTVADVGWHDLFLEVSVWQALKRGEGNTVDIKDVWIGKVFVDLSLFDRGWRDIDGWYHLLDGQHQTRGQVKIHVRNLSLKENNLDFVPALSFDEGHWSASKSPSNPTIYHNNSELIAEVLSGSPRLSLNNGLREAPDVIPSPLVNLTIPEKDAISQSQGAATDSVQVVDQAENDKAKSEMMIPDTIKQHETLDRELVEPKSQHHIEDAGVNRRAETSGAELPKTNAVTMYGTSAESDDGNGCTNDDPEIATLEINAQFHQPITLASLGTIEMELSPISDKLSLDVDENKKDTTMSPRFIDSEMKAESTNCDERISDSIAGSIGHSRALDEIEECMQESKENTLDSHSFSSAESESDGSGSKVTHFKDEGGELSQPSGCVREAASSLESGTAANEVSKSNMTPQQLHFDGDIIDIDFTGFPEIISGQTDENVSADTNRVDFDRTTSELASSNDNIIIDPESAAEVHQRRDDDSNSMTNSPPEACEKVMSLQIEHDMESRADAISSLPPDSAPAMDTCEDELNSAASLKSADTVSKVNTYTKTDFEDSSCSSSSRFASIPASRVDARDDMEVVMPRTGTSGLKHRNQLTAEVADKATQVDPAELECLTKTTFLHTIDANPLENVRGNDEVNAQLQAEGSPKHQAEQSEKPPSLSGSVVSTSTDQWNHESEDEVEFESTANVKRDPDMQARVLETEISATKTTKDCSCNSRDNILVVHPHGCVQDKQLSNVQSHVDDSNSVHPGCQNEKLEVVYEMLREMRDSFFAMPPTKADIAGHNNAVKNVDNENMLETKQVLLLSHDVQLSTDKQTHTSSRLKDPPEALVSDVTHEESTSITPQNSMAKPDVMSRLQLEGHYLDPVPARTASRSQSDKLGASFRAGIGSTLSSDSNVTKAHFGDIVENDEHSSVHSLFVNDSETERIARIMQGSMTYWMKDDSSSSCEDAFQDEEDSDDDCYF
ncbi:unnamed protein product [Phytophthora lilii]|uniref:Unnamed protein product n=1 Tax=Phytophthora lilii TaxID=2077276 RepID=A0A9W7D8Z1_9STRA|nr:unnamed protein product [Phytophthora lilii]